MIAFDLQCAEGHCFEGWFEDSNAYEYQKKKGLLSCPVCNDTRISKVPSTFSIKSSQTVAPLGGDVEKIANLSQKVEAFVKENFDDVGCNFATEALKIHYGVAEPRNIRGVSTQQEEKTLEKEGITFFKIPMAADWDEDA